MTYLELPLQYKHKADIKKEHVLIQVKTILEIFPHPEIEGMTVMTTVTGNKDVRMPYARVKELIEHASGKKSRAEA